MEAPLRIADLTSAGLGCLGFFFVFQPSRIAQTFGLSSLLAEGSSAGISRLIHKRYIDIAYRLQKQSEASETEIKRLTKLTTDLEHQQALWCGSQRRWKLALRE
jgi:hypothetical protein